MDTRNESRPMSYAFSIECRGGIPVIFQGQWSDRLLVSVVLQYVDTGITQWLFGLVEQQGSGKSRG